MAKSDANDAITPLPTGARRCPICGKTVTARDQPFCSARCANIDLGRWLKGNYSVPTDEPPEDGADGDER